MRVSPVGWAFEIPEETLAEAQRSAEVTHNHPEGIKGAQSVAAAIFLARRGAGQTDILDALETRFGYNLHRTYEDIQPSCTFGETCQRSVPEARSSEGLRRTISCVTIRLHATRHSRMPF